MACVDELVKVYFRIYFSYKEIMFLLAHKHSKYSNSEYSTKYKHVEKIV